MVSKIAVFDTYGLPGVSIIHVTKKDRKAPCVEH